MAIYIKPTLTLESTGGTSGVSEDSSLSLSVTSASANGLTVTDPMIGISKIACTTTGGDTVILPNVAAGRWVYIKNTGVDAADSATTATLKVELADNTRIIDLGADEFCFFPYNAEGSGFLQLEASALLPDGETASSGTIVAEYGYWTKV